MSMSRTGKALRATGAIGIAALIAAVALSDAEVVQAQPPAQPPIDAPPFAGNALPAYPGAHEAPLGEGWKLNGAPMGLSHGVTRDRSERVRDFYVDWFEGRGQSALVRSFDSGGFAISAEDSSSGVEVTIVVQPSGASTQIFASTLALAVPSALSAPDLPLTPRAVGLVQLVGRGEGSVSYEEPAEALGDLLGHLEKGMGDRGWSLERRRADASGGQLAFARGVERWHFDLAARPSGVAVLARFSSGEASP
jgi:hypothetical protein